MELLSELRVSHVRQTIVLAGQLPGTAKPGPVRNQACVEFVRAHEVCCHTAEAAPVLQCVLPIPPAGQFAPRPVQRPPGTTLGAC